MNTIQSTILRFEDKNGKGLYRGEIDFNTIIGEGDDYTTEQHPTPNHDSLFRENYQPNSIWDLEEFVYGFTDMQQLRRWLYKDEWLIKLYEHFKCYEVEGEVIVGHTQAAVRNGVKIRELTLKDFGL